MSVTTNTSVKQRTTTQINQRKAECIAAARAGDQAGAVQAMFQAQKRKAQQAKNYKKKRAKWYKEGNAEKPKPLPSSPLPRIDPAADAVAAKAKSKAAARRLLVTSGLMSKMSKKKTFCKSEVQDEELDEIEWEEI